MNKIDFVIAWVDGSDPKHQAKRAQYSGQNVSAEAMLSTRFASDDEIYFSIASILKYVPYCGKIYVVTDQQKPLFYHLNCIEIFSYLLKYVKLAMLLSRNSLAPFYEKYYSALYLQ